MDYPPSLNTTHYDRGIVTQANIYANYPVARKLDDWVIGDDREREDRLISLDSDERQGNPAIRKPRVIEVKDQPIPRASDDHFQDNLAIGEWVVLDDCVLEVYGTEVYVVTAIRGSGGFSRWLTYLELSPFAALARSCHER